MESNPEPSRSFHKNLLGSMALLLQTVNWRSCFYGLVGRKSMRDKSVRCSNPFGCFFPSVRDHSNRFNLHICSLKTMGCSGTDSKGFLIFALVAKYFLVGYSFLLTTKPLKNTRA